MRLALRGFLRSWLCTESFANSPAYFSGSFRSLKYQGVRGTHLGAKMNSRKRSYTTLLDDGGGIAVLELVRHGHRPDLPVHERLHHLADALRHLVELEIHRVPPWRAPARRYAMMPPSRRAAISLSSMTSSRSTAAVSALVLGGCARRGASPLKRTGKRPRRMRP